MKYTLRRYQNTGMAGLREAFRVGRRRIVLQCPTGGGKTILALHIIEGALAKGKRILFLAHRKELIKQPYRKLMEHGLDPALMSAKYGGSKYYNPDSPLQFYCVDSIKLDKLPPADIVINDECHRAVGPKQKRIVESYPDALCIGLTATPERLDGRGLGDLYEDIIVVAKPSELVAEGSILDPLIYTVAEEQLPDLAGLSETLGDFDKDELAQRVQKVAIISSIVENWKLHAQGKRTICFAVNRDHSKSIAAAFVEAGIRARHIDALTPDQEREDALEALGEGRIDVLCQCELLIEGVDIPSVKCVILARPTKSITMLLQSIGRAVRPWEGQEAIVLDHAGNIVLHGLPMEDRIYSLEGRSKGKKKATPSSVKTCPECYFLARLSATVCGGCGYSFSAASCELPETKEGMLQRLKKEQMEARQLQHWNTLADRARANGYPATWMAYEYAKRWKMPSPYPEPDLTPTPEIKKRVLKQLAQKQTVLNLPWRWVEGEYYRRFKEAIPLHRR